MYVDADIVALGPFETLFNPCAQTSMGHDYPRHGEAKQVSRRALIHLRRPIFSTRLAASATAAASTSRHSPPKPHSSDEDHCRRAPQPYLWLHARRDRPQREAARAAQVLLWRARSLWASPPAGPESQSIDSRCTPAPHPAPRSQAVPHLLVAMRWLGMLRGGPGRFARHRGHLLGHAHGCLALHG